MNLTAVDFNRHIKLVYGPRFNAPLLERGDQSVIDFFYSRALPNPCDIHQAGANGKIENHHTASVPMARHLRNRTVNDGVLKSAKPCHDAKIRR